ncbi:MAG: NAD-binding protein [Gammaproteobacteria bacterium]|nr:NAD-binding protein [Gammaproteobacteria bacterium]
MLGNHHVIFSPIERVIIILLVVAAFILGILGYFDYFDGVEDVTFSDVIYATLGLFVLEFEGQPSDKLPILLDIARWVAPISLVYAGIKTILALMGDRLDYIKLKCMRNHAVICGLNEYSLLTIKDLVAGGIKVIVIEAGKDSPFIGVAKEQGILVLFADATDKKNLERVNLRWASHLLVTTGDDSRNLEIAYQAFELHQAFPKYQHLKCVVDVDSNEFSAALYTQAIFNQDYENFSAQVLNYSKQAARLLVRDFGPDTVISLNKRLDKVLRILIIGNHPFVEDFILSFAAIGHYGLKEKLHISFFGDGVSARIKALIEKRPMLVNIVTITYADVAPSMLNNHHTAASIRQFSPDVIYLCAFNLKYTMVWVRALLDLQLDIPFLVAEFMNSLALEKFKTQLEDRMLSFIPLLSLSCESEQVFSVKQDRLAKAIHDNYVAKQVAAGDMPSNNASLVDWRMLPESLKDSNRSQADHLDIKLRLLEIEHLASGDDMQKILTDETVEKMANVEHSRWMAEKLLAGWQVTEGKKDAARRLSPDLVPWEELGEIEKQKDRDTVQVIPEVVALRESLK